MKIALVVPALELGGGVPAVADFMARTAMEQAGYGLKLVSLSTTASDAESLRVRSPRSWIDRPRTRQGTWRNLPFTHVGAVLGELEFQRYRPRRALARLIDDCDVIQVVCGSPAWANAVMGMGKPVAVHVATRALIERRERDRTPKTLVDHWRKAMTRITDRMDDRALRRADAIQAMNPWLLEYARAINTGRSVDVRYAPPGVNAGAYRPDSRRDPAHEHYILCVGRLDDPRKNVSMLLDTLMRLPDALRAGTRLVLAGSSGPPAEFWERASMLGLAHQIEFVKCPSEDKLLRLYQQASVLVSPSAEEGFGMVIIEAMACGIPVVSTRSGGPDGIISDGQDGYLVPLNDPTTMAERIAQLLENPAHNRAIGVNARLTIEQRYDTHVAGSVFINIWNQLLHATETHDPES